MSDEFKVGDIVYGGFRGGFSPCRVTRVCAKTIRVTPFPGMPVDKKTLRGCGDDDAYVYFRTPEIKEGTGRALPADARARRSNS